MKKRSVHQWQQIGQDCDDKTRHWAEIMLTADELLGMLGCASGSTLVSLHIDRDGASLTITADEHQEAPPCPLADEPPYSSGQS
jgi:hypothetical protein